MFHRSELLEIEGTLVKIKLGARVDTFLECADSAAVKEDFNSRLELEAVINKKE